MKFCGLSRFFLLLDFFMHVRIRHDWLFGVAVVALFVLVSGSAVMYGYGYRYDSRANRLETTSVLVVNGDVSDVMVRLDDEVVADSLPAKLVGLHEGFRKLMIDKQGFLPWERTVQLDQGLILSIPEVLLVPRDRPVVQVALKGGAGIPAGAALVGASEDVFIFRRGARYSIYLRDEHRSYPLPVPVNLHDVVFDARHYSGYGLRRATAPTAAPSSADVLVSFRFLPHGTIEIVGDEPFPYLRTGLTNMRVDDRTHALLFERRGEIVTLTPHNGKDETAVLTRFSDPVTALTWFHDLFHFVIQIGDDLRFCDDAFTNCYSLARLAPEDSFTADETGVWVYRSVQRSAEHIPLILPRASIFNSL